MQFDAPATLAAALDQFNEVPLGIGEEGEHDTGSLVTGSLWGRPMWGTYWAWDPRLTSELILLFLYVGVMSLRSAFEDPGRGDRAAALLAIVGVVNIPIIHYSVVWWGSASSRGYGC